MERRELARWVDDRAAAADLRLSDEDAPFVYDTAHGLVPHIQRWRQHLVDSPHLPFPMSGRLREPPPQTRPTTRIELGPRSETDDPFHTLIATARSEQPASGALQSRFTVKANIDLAGITTSCGASPELVTTSTWLPDHTSPIVQSLIDAGAELVGLANLGELALNATSDNPWHGRVDNPVAPGRTPGGSSGGSAAGVAAGLADIALGTDSAGSVRIPAAFCEVTGYRPTPGRIALDGLRGSAWSIDTIGIMGSSVANIRDAALAAGVLREPISQHEPTIGFLAGQELGAVEPGVQASYETAIRTLSSDVNSSPVDLSGLVDGPAIAAVIAYAEVANHLAHIARTSPTSLGRPARQLVQFGALLSADDYLVAQRMRSVLWTRWVEATADIDIVLTPTVPLVPFRHGTTPQIEGDNSDVAIFALIRFTAIANVLALPAIAIPMGRAAGLPTGLQLIGKHDADELLLSTAATFETVIGP